MKTEEKVKVRDQVLYHCHILDTMIFFSSIDGDRRLPTGAEDIRDALSDAVIEYVSGIKPIKITNELMIWDRFKQNVETHKGKLHESIEDALFKLLKPHFVVGQMGDRGYNYNFEDWFYTMVMDPISRPTSMQGERVAEVKELIPKLSEHELRNVIDIGRLMREYIVRYDRW